MSGGVPVSAAQSTAEHREGVLDRWPGEESVGLYPGLVVSDGDHRRQAASITVGRTRLPVWAFIGQVVEAGWGAADDYYHDGDEYVFGAQAASGFFTRASGRMATVRRCYGVPAYRGRAVQFRGIAHIILSSTGSHLWLRCLRSGVRVGPCHPTWEMDYGDGRDYGAEHDARIKAAWG